jgi:hypothetical protein
LLPSLLPAPLLLLLLLLLPSSCQAYTPQPCAAEDTPCKQLA